MRLHKSIELVVSANHYIALEVDHAVERMLEQMQREQKMPVRLVTVTHTPMATALGETVHVLVTVVAEVDTSQLEREAPRIEYKTHEIRQGG